MLTKESYLMWGSTVYWVPTLELSHFYIFFPHKQATTKTLNAD